MWRLLLSSSHVPKTYLFLSWHFFLAAEFQRIDIPFLFCSRGRFSKSGLSTEIRSSSNRTIEKDQCIQFNFSYLAYRTFCHNKRIQIRYYKVNLISEFIFFINICWNYKGNIFVKLPRKWSEVAIWKTFFFLVHEWKMDHRFPQEPRTRCSAIFRSLISIFFARTSEFLTLIKIYSCNHKK